MTSVVHGESDVAAIAALFAEPARARMLCALTDGRALPASVLASEAGVAASTASEHLARLSAAGLLTVEQSGRHRYFRIADDRVVAAIESLATLAPQRPVRSLRESTRAAALRRARTCYDHLAGRLGVAVTEAMLDRGWLLDATSTPGREPPPVGHLPPDEGLALSGAGRAELGRLGVDVPAGDVVRCCIDWTEQRRHVSGAHGRAVFARLVDLGWLHRAAAGRAVSVTRTGAAGFAAELGVDTELL